jgi:hypothetical protein
VLSLAGWAWGVEWLVRAEPRLPPVRPVVAAGLVLLGAALWLAAPAGVAGWRRVVGRMLAAGVAAIGAIGLVEAAMGRELGPARWLFTARLAAMGYPGRPPLPVAVLLVMFGAALLLLDLGRRRLASTVLMAVNGAASLAMAMGWLEDVIAPSLRHTR